MLGIYCRISQLKEEGKDRSILDQKKLGINLAKKLRLKYKVYIDEGISGTNDIKDRPSFSKMLNDIEEGKLTHIYAFDQSRLERSPEVRLILQKLLKENYIKLFTETGEVDLNNDEIEMLGDIMSSFNAYFVRLTKKKVKSVLKRNVSEGKTHGILPYGFKKDDNGFMVINENEAEIVREIYSLSLSGNGTNKIAEILNIKEIPTRYNLIGKGTLNVKDQFGNVKIIPKKNIKWSGNGVRSIIVNTIYKGGKKMER